MSGGLTVGDLKNVISDLPEDTLVILSSDEEGNSFHYWTYGAVEPYETDGWDINIAGEEENDFDYPKALVLWP
jgi:hypothetical protein